MGASYKWITGDDGARRLVESTQAPQEDSDAAAKALYERLRGEASVPAPPWEELGTSRRLFWRAVSERGILDGGAQ